MRTFLKGHEGKIFCSLYLIAVSPVSTPLGGSNLMFLITKINLSFTLSDSCVSPPQLEDFVAALLLLRHRTHLELPSLQGYSPVQEEK